MSESKLEIRKQIIKILSYENDDISKKSDNILALAFKLSPQVGIEFLDVYSEMFNEGNLDRMSAAKISKILNACIPNDIIKFLKFTVEDPIRLVEFTSAIKKFMSSFPYSYMEVIQPYHISALSSSYFLSNSESISTFKSMPNSLSLENYRIMISVAILCKRDDVLLNIIEDIPSDFLQEDIAFELIDKKNYKLDVLDKIVKKTNLSYTKIVNYETPVLSYRLSLPLFIALIAMKSGDINCLKLFEKIQEDGIINNKAENYAHILKLSKGKVNKLNFINFLYELHDKDSFNNFNKIIDILIQNKNIQPSLYISIINLVITNKSVRDKLEISSIENLFNNDVIYSKYIDKEKFLIKLLSNAIKMGSFNNLEPTQIMLDNLINKFPKEIDEITIFQIWSYSGNKSLYKKNILLNNLIEKSIFNNMEYVKKDCDISFGNTGILSKGLEFKNFLIENKLINVKKVEKKVGSFFNKKLLVEEIYEWNDKEIQALSKYKDVKPLIEKYSFLTSDSGESMNLDLIKTLPNKQLQSISENLVMIAYQFSNFSNDPLFSLTEESHFLKNNLPKMFNKIIANYHEFKTFDNDSAIESLKSQLILLHKKSTSCMNIIVNDIHYELKKEVKVNTQLLSTPINKEVKVNAELLRTPVKKENQNHENIYTEILNKYKFKAPVTKY